MIINSRSLAWNAIAAVGLALLMHYINGQNASLLPLLLFASVLFVNLIARLLEANAMAYRRRELQKHFIEHLCRIRYYRSKGGAEIHAINAATKSIDGRLRAAAEEAVRRYLMQGDYLSHFACMKDLSSCFSVMKEGRLDDIIRNHDLALQARDAQIGESAQRHATVNMFISTILPSFLVFAFVGGSVLSQASFGMLQFSMLLLMIIPLAYSVGNMLMWRRLFA